MNNGNELWDMIGSFFKAVIDVIITVFWWIYYIFAFIFSSVGNLLKKIYIPLLPTKTRIFQENAVSGTILVLFILLIVIVNISAFNSFKKDKMLAIKQDDGDEFQHRRVTRISERNLLKKCFFGGALGAYLAMKIFRHKTLKPKFTVTVAVLLFVQLLLYSIVIGYFSFWLYFA